MQRIFESASVRRIFQKCKIDVFFGGPRKKNQSRPRPRMLLLTHPGGHITASLTSTIPSVCLSFEKAVTDGIAISARFSSLQLAPSVVAHLVVARYMTSERRHCSSVSSLSSWMSDPSY